MAVEGMERRERGTLRNGPGVVVVYHVTVVTIRDGLLKKFWPLVIGCVLRTAGSSIIRLLRPAYFVRTTQLLPHPDKSAQIPAARNQVRVSTIHHMELAMLKK